MKPLLYKQNSDGARVEYLAVKITLFSSVGVRRTSFVQTWFQPLSASTQDRYPKLLIEPPVDRPAVVLARPVVEPILALLNQGMK